MKKLFLHTLALVLLTLCKSAAQEFPKTYYNFPCVNCTPAGYSIVAGGPVAMSNMAGLGGSPTKPWVNAFSAPPSSSKAIDQNSAKVFLTLRHSTIQKDKLKVELSGFEVGNKYTFHYYVMTARADLNMGTSSYAASAIMEVQTSSFLNVASRTTTFTPNVNVNTWVEESLTFTAPAANLTFFLSGTSNPQETAFVNFDIYSKPFDCIVPGGEVQLFRSTVATPFACATTNLYDLVKGSPPAGTVPVWGLNSSSSYPQLTDEQAKAASPKPVGQYYYAFYRTPGGCYNTAISTTKVSFTATPTQVALTGNQKSIDCINQTSVDLTAQVVPSNYKVQWFTNDKHEGLPIDNPQAAPAGDYFAFYFDSKNNCYSVDKAAVSAVFSVVGSTMCCNDPNDPTNDIPLSNTDVKIVAPAQTYDLTQLVPSNLSLPPNVVLEWYTSANHSGVPITDPKHVGAGKYYVFAHDLVNGCFNLPQAKKGVTVSKACNAGMIPVTLKDISNEYFCQDTQVKLSDLVISPQLPPGISVLWFDNNTHTGNPVSTGLVSGGQYYAYYYDNVNQCYSPGSSISLLSKQVSLSCGEDGCELSTGCPPVGVNLNALHLGPVPDGWELQWFPNTTHSGEKIANPTSVIQPGEYYSFYYNIAKQCYNKTGLQNGGNDTSNKKVSVTSEACSSGPQLSLRVALQGAIETVPSDDLMRNDLQTYFGSSGLLPTTSPYGDLAACPEIGDASKMDDVVDWVKVEVRDAVDPTILLESKSLILWTTGFVGNLDGTPQPSFTSQSKSVRIVVKHRNHLAIMSNPIQDFSAGSTVSYDFTTALSQASNEFGDPIQMVQKNGIWCLPSGDVNETPDFVVDGKDGTFFNTQFKSDAFDSYDRADVNLDGVVDGVDGTLFNINFYLDIFSTLVNY